MTDITTETPFFVTPSPYRAPAIVLWVTSLAIGLGMPLVSYLLDAPVISFEPMFVALLAAILVGACASIAGKHLHNARTVLYGATAATLVLAGWMAFDAIQTGRAEQLANRRLASDLTALCREEGGQSLADATCARYERIFDNYHYPNGVPADVEAMRAGELP